MGRPRKHINAFLERATGYRIVNTARVNELNRAASQKALGKDIQSLTKLVQRQEAAAARLEGLTPGGRSGGSRRPGGEGGRAPGQAR